MRSYPIPILNTFRDAYTRSDAILIPYRVGSESSDGILYRFQDEVQDRLLKVMFLGSGDIRIALLHFESRLKFIDFLSKQGVHVTEPLPSLNDRLYEILQDQSGTWIAYAMKRIHGKTMSPKVWNPDFFQNWGRTIGKCHRAAQGYPEWEYCIDPVTSERFLTWEEEWDYFHQLCREREIRAAWEQIGEELRSLPIQHEAFGFIHNDPHLWNLLVEGDQVTLIDFDVSTHHWFVNDISIACQHVLRMLSGGASGPVHHRQHLVDFIKEFLKGYNQENDLSLEWLEHLDLFFAYRSVLNYVLMPGWRWSKPELQQSWKEMIINRPPVLGRIDFEI